MDPKLSANLYVVMLDLYNCQPAAATPTYSDTYHLSVCIIVRWPASLDVQLRVRDGHVVRYALSSSPSESAVQLTPLALSLLPKSPLSVSRYASETRNVKKYLDFTLEGVVCHTKP